MLLNFKRCVYSYLKKNVKTCIWFSSQNTLKDTLVYKFKSITAFSIALQIVALISSFTKPF